MKMTVYLNDALSARVREEMPDLNYSALFSRALKDEMERRQAEIERQIAWAEGIYGAKVDSSYFA